MTRPASVVGRVAVLLALVAGSLLVSPTARAIGPVEVVGSHGTDSPGWTAAPPAAPVNLDVVAIDTAGNLYQIERSIEAIVKVSSNGTETVFAGRGTTPPSTTPTPATSVALGSIGLIALDPQGNLYITADGPCPAQPCPDLLLKVDTAGLLTLVAGSGVDNPPSPTSAPATSVSLTGVRSIAFGPDQAVYLSDISNGVIARVDTTGMIKVVAGGGDLAPSRFPTPATTVDLKDPYIDAAQVSIAFRPDGTLLLADSSSNDIYEVASGMLAVIGYDGSHPESIAVSPSGTVFLGGVERVNLLTPSGTVTPLPVNFPVGFPTQVAHDGTNSLFVTSRGTGEIVKVQSPGDLPPDAPSAVQAVRGDRSVQVSWVPGSDNGSPITGYTITSSPGGITSTVGGDTTTATVTGLTNGTTYSFTVKATSAFGTSMASARSNSVSPAGVPDAPIGVNAARGDRSAWVSWYRQSDNGSPITGYTITSSPGGITSTVAGAATDARVTGLANGTAYTFTVKATNSVGSSVASGPSNAVTPAEVPDAPTAVQAVRGDRSAQVSWVPGSDNGSPITGYTITSSPGGMSATVAGTATTATVNWLTNGSAYTFTVRARNALGPSAASAPSTAVTPEAAPTSTPAPAPAPAPATAPSMMKAPKIVVRGTRAIVKWAAATPNGTAVYKYVVDISKGRDKTTAASARKAVFKRLKPGRYKFRIAAVNAVGTSPYSAWVKIRIR